MLNAFDTDCLNQLEAALPGVVGPAEPAYLEEPRGLYRSVGAHVAKPRSTQEVATLVKLANERRFGIVPYGGGTGLVGAQIQTDGPPALVVSLERMARIREISTTDHTLVAEAGVILAEIHAAAEARDMIFPLSLAAEGSARIGGNLATNAGGVNVLRYGNARDLCFGVEAVLPNGEILSGLKALRKDNTGYDLRHLLIGAEGTLGIITAARLKLYPRPVNVATALIDVADPAAALTLLRRLQAELGEVISAFELIDATGVDFIRATLPDIATGPAGHGRWHVLIEVAGGAGFAAEALLEEALEAPFEEGLAQGGTLAQSRAQRQELWTIRETIPLANRKIGSIVSNDISVPVGAIPEFVRAGHEAIAAFDPDLRINAFGHLGDGNLHYNIFPPHGATAEEYALVRTRIKDIVQELVVSFGGSISAEHGIGRAKRADLERHGDPAKLAAMRAIKSALDPVGIMNPGALV